MESIVDHLCRLDHFLPKSVLIALEDDDDIEPCQRELIHMLDRLLMRFTQHIDDVTLSGYILVKIIKKDDFFFLIISQKFEYTKIDQPIIVCVDFCVLANQN